MNYLNLKLDSKKKVISVFEVVRDIPYGYIGSRDPGQVLRQGMGTCSGKHILLGELYKLMGIKVKYIMCLTKLNFLEPILPDHLKEVLGKNELFDYHNYLKIFIDNKWIDVDATFDSALGKYGFIVNKNWDGKSNCKIALKPIRTYVVKDIIVEKEKFLNRLPVIEQKLRKNFIRDLSSWMQLLRKVNI